MNDHIDRGALTLTRSIALAESGGGGMTPNYNAVGDAGTSHGAYQWQPGNFESAAIRFGLDPKDFSPVNQDKVAYRQVKEMKDRGFTPEQIAATWNAGSAKALDGSWQTNRGTTTINGQSIAYDTPAYVQRVNHYYRQLSPQQPNIITGPQMGGIPQEQPSYLQDLGNTATNAVQGVSDAMAKGFTGEINPLSALIQGGGALAGGLTEGVNKTVEHLPVVGDIWKGAEGLIGQGVQAAAGTDVGKSAIGAYQTFAEQHPEFAADIGAGVNIASAIPMLKGLGLVKDLAKGGLDAALTGSKDAIYEAVAPELSAKETAAAIAKRGTAEKGLLRQTVLNPDPYYQNVANTVKTFVPEFNPSANPLKNINLLSSKVTQLSSDLKTAVGTAGEGRIFPIRELESRLNGLEKPVMVASDQTLGNAYKRVIAKAIDIVRKTGGKVPKLLDARQELDAFLEKQFPNLYSSDTLTPLRQAVRDVRSTITDFTAEKLPDGFGLQEALRTQHMLLDAIESMSEKASKSSSGILGTNAAGRFIKRHPIIPGLVRTGMKGIEIGTGIKVGEGLINDLTQ